METQRYKPGDHKDDVRYLFEGHSQVLTDDEKAAWRTLIATEKMANADSAKMKEMIQKRWINSEPKAEELLKEGEEAFFRRTLDRIERENPSALNTCPKCGSLCRTSEACLCPNCSFTWFETRED